MKWRDKIAKKLMESKENIWSEENIGWIQKTINDLEDLEAVPSSQSAMKDVAMKYMQGSQE